jgi:hypothetical protein
VLSALLGSGATKAKGINVSIRNEGKVAPERPTLPTLH